MVRAVTIIWLFGGLRMDEIRRLPLGCTRRQWNQTPPPVSGVCDLHVPVNKTSLAFTKSVDEIVGDAVRTWEAERPEQPPLLDEKTGGVGPLSFMFRCRQIARKYVNKTLVPVLCRKAGHSHLRTSVANITTHRARSTIASQLFNAKEPMSLLELQKWLGHKWANSTQYYLDISPTKLAHSYRDAGYFARNVRSIEVLIDRRVVKAGQAAPGPWMFYDLGHGYCSYDFFDRCQHRMACAKCSYYRPKGSSRGPDARRESRIFCGCGKRFRLPTKNGLRWTMAWQPFERLLEQLRRRADSCRTHSASTSRRGAWSNSISLPPRSLVEGVGDEK